MSSSTENLNGILTTSLLMCPFLYELKGSNSSAQHYISSLDSMEVIWFNVAGLLSKLTAIFSTINRHVQLLITV